MNNALMVHCPTCRAPVAWTADNPHRPFCSETCKLIDLGAWADDKRAIPCAEDETLEDWER